MILQSIVIFDGFELYTEILDFEKQGDLNTTVQVVDLSER